MLHRFLLTLALTGVFCAFADDPPENVVFRSDVALVRVDAQVLDRDQRAITRLRAEDFVLREDGRVLPVRNFASENMPIDILLLLDVSGSMRVHVERIADAAHQALHVLANGDRVGIMVFDTSTRVRMPFRASHEDVNREFERLLSQERFNGGTDITRALYDAADYVRREGRRDARRAIVILTDDETHGKSDEPGVERALERADAVLSLLLAPSMEEVYRRGGGGYPRGGSTWPGGGGIGGTLGGIIFPRRGGYGGRQPGGIGFPGEGHSAGTAEIARDSGGDTMNVDDASALETTLERLRQRYALYFHMPDAAQAGEERSIEVDLSNAARRRYPEAEIRYRRVYLAPGSSSTSAGHTKVTRAPGRVPVAGNDPYPSSGSSDDPPVVRRRRVAVDQPDGPRVNLPGTVDPDTGSKADSAPPSAPAPAPPAKPGWRRATDPAPTPPGQ